MATTSACASLKAGQDVSCLASPSRRYYQQAVIINKSDIDPATVVKTLPTAVSSVCNYNVAFALKDGATGYAFKGSENGSTYVGYFDKATNELTGNPDYTHHAQLLVMGVAEATKCILNSLDRGSYVVAYQFYDNTIEIYGFDSGLTTEDYTYNAQEGGGGQAIILSSREISPEPNQPYAYKSGTEDGEIADFDALFANV